MAIMLLVLAGFFAAVFGFVAWRAEQVRKALRAYENPPQVVAATRAVTTEWRRRVEGVGTFRAVNGTDLSLEQSGVVEKLHFKSGDDVKAGQILLDLRKEPEVAKLEALRASVELAEQNYRRDAAQLKQHAVSQSTVDSDIANLKSARAEVAQAEALIAQKTLRAPFTGRLGIRLVDVGQYVAAGAPVVTLQDLDPILMDFTAPQQYVELLTPGQSLSAKVDAFPQETFTGVITAINPKVDAQSRNIEVRASLPNHDRKLLPGMFASLEINAGKSERFVTLPSSAIVYGPYGDSVFLVVSDADAAKENRPPSPTGMVVRQSFVQLGATRGDLVAVTKGVLEGANVVTSGQMKLRKGTPVQIDNRLAPASNSNPAFREQ